jgi:ABC-type glutathione transport system ATPase component
VSIDRLTRRGEPGDARPAPAGPSSDHDSNRDGRQGPGLRKIYRPARYREVTALNGVDLDIGAGEIVALLGPNGAGKTTAVQILTGYRRRDGGEVSVLGADPAAAGRGWRARNGIVPQQASDFAELTVLEEAGGRLGVLSSPGAGTTVSVMVPLPGGDGPGGQAGVT